MSGAIRLLPLCTLKACTRPADKGSISRCSQRFHRLAMSPLTAHGSLWTAGLTRQGAPKPLEMCRDSSVITVTTLWTKLAVQLRLPTLQCPHQLWGPLRLLTNGHRRSFHGSKTARVWILPPISSWCQSKHAWSHSSSPHTSSSDVASLSVGDILNLYQLHWFYGNKRMIRQNKTKLTQNNKRQVRAQYTGVSDLACGVEKSAFSTIRRHGCALQ